MGLPDYEVGAVDHAVTIEISGREADGPVVVLPDQEIRACDRPVAVSIALREIRAGWWDNCSATSGNRRR